MARTRKAAAPLDAATLRILAEALRPTELGHAQRASLRERVLARATADQPANTETIRGDQLPWHQPWPQVWVKVLTRDVDNDVQIMLFKLGPGGVVPGHDHGQREECLVLDGEVSVGGHRVARGDLHIAHPGAAHPDIVSRTGALLMVRSSIEDSGLRQAPAVS